MVKRLIIGDIHGCLAELNDLFDAAGLAADDEIIAIGDIVDRGPDSPAVLQFFQQTSNAQSLIGNHERKHVRSHRGEIRPALSQLIARRQIGEDAYEQACRFMDSLPRFIELPEAILVHGFFEPGLPLAEQRDTVVVGTLSGEHHLAKQYDRPWYELYDGDKPLIVGHHDYLGSGEPLICDDKVFGIDTGCCHGGRLTGLLLPEFRLVSVPSRRDYWTELQQQYADIRYSATPKEDLTWEAARSLVESAHKQTSVPPKVQERASDLQNMLIEAERALEALFDHIDQKHRQTVADLRKELPFDSLDAKKQGSLFAKAIGKTPLSSFLHQARRGQLDLEKLRAHFKKPSEVVKFARHVGVLRASVADDVTRQGGESDAG